MFDFIEAVEFRRSLESDYAEMHRCSEARAWKSVQVLAGSIVEALLVDYLAATKDKRGAGTDPLRMDLAKAIEVCRAEGLLSDRTRDLSTVVRSYRNLIHPGRLVRLGEEPPSESGSVIAMKLVDMIITQVESRRKEAFGLTAEQLLSKIERDEDSIVILKHLLTDVNAVQRARFLLDVLPPRYLELKTQEGPNDEPFSPLWMKLDRLPRAYRLVLDSVEDETKRRVAQRFVKVLREEDGDTVRVVREAFFHPDDLPNVSDDQRALVKEHLLGAAPHQHTVRTAEYLSDLAPFLAEADVRNWVDPYITALLSSTTQNFVRARVRKAFVEGAVRVGEELEEVLDARLERWISYATGRDQLTDAQYVRDLKEEIESARLPF